jgi:hypothetical protein
MSLKLRLFVFVILSMPFFVRAGTFKCDPLAKARAIAANEVDLAGLNRSSSCDKIWAKKGLGHGKKEIHT